MSDKQMLKYYLTLMKYNKDPIIRAHLLIKIKNLFPKEIPTEIKDFIKSQQKILEKIFTKQLKEKKIAYEKFIKEQKEP